MLFIKKTHKMIISLFIMVIALICLVPSNVFADENDNDDSIAATARKTRVIVSMGDSFSAGEGIEPFYGSRFSKENELADWLARRSIDSWPGQLRLPTVGEMRDYKDGKGEDAQWYFVAASGAVVWHIQNKYERKYLTGSSLNDLRAEFVELEEQIKVFEKLNTDDYKVVPDYVTLTLGGNDLGFVPIVTEALLLPSYNNPAFIYLALKDATTKLDEYTENEEKKREPCVREKLAQAYVDIYERASTVDEHPWILVAGYPHLLNDGLDKSGKSVGDTITNLYIYDPIEALLINNRIDYFNKAIEDICNQLHNAGMNIKYVDVKDEFSGHEAYTKDPWINGVEIPTDKESLDPRPLVLFEKGWGVNVNGKSMHPTAVGAYKGYRKRVQEAIDELEGRRVTKLLVNAFDADTLEPIVDKEMTITFSNQNIECTLSKQLLRSEDGYATFYVSYDYNTENIDSDVTLHVDGYKDYIVEEYPFKKETADLQAIPAMLEKDNTRYSAGGRKMITFGNYGGEDIDWIVLDENEDGMFIVSEKILDEKEFNPEVNDLTWEESELRKWLNDDFINLAFNSDEKERILKTNIKNLDNPEVFYAKGGNDTDDYVFLLSFDEIYRLFDNDDDADLRAGATKYAVENGTRPAENNCCFWWLRTPGSSDRNGVAGFMYVNYLGEHNLYSGMPVYCKMGVRPVLWISKDENDGLDIDVVIRDTEDGAEINKWNFPDDIFRAYISKEIESDHDDMLGQKELDVVTKIDVDQLGLSDLTGIDCFTNLQELTCKNNNISTLDLSQNKKLKRLDCTDNKLTVLDVTKNESLEELICEFNSITELDVSCNPNLKILDCSQTTISTIDVSHNSTLEKLICSRLGLKSLDVSHNPALVHLACAQNDLSVLDVSHNINLKRLYCAINNITELDVSNNTALEMFDCSMNDLTSLDVKNNTALKELQCYSNNITTLDVSHNPSLERLCCDVVCAPESSTIKSIITYK